MKILFASDFHVDLKHAGLDRHEEIMEAFRVVIDKSHTVDLTVFGGDVFHTPRPSARAYSSVFELIQQIGSPSVWLLGNHEVPGGPADVDAYGPFRVIQFEREVKIVHLPVITDVHGKRLMLCPYINDARAIAGFKAQELVNQVFEEALKVKVDGAFCHLDADGATTGNEEFMLRGGRLQMPMDIAKQLPCDVVNGHIHQQQRMAPNIVMPGSPVATDFGERKQKHGYCYVQEI